MLPLSMATLLQPGQVRMWLFINVETLSSGDTSALLDIVNALLLHPGMLTLAAPCTNTIYNLLLS